MLISVALHALSWISQLPLDIPVGGAACFRVASLGPSMDAPFVIFLLIFVSSLSSLAPALKLWLYTPFGFRRFPHLFPHLFYL